MGPAGLPPEPNEMPTRDAPKAEADPVGWSTLFSTSRRVARAERTPPRGIFLFFVAAGPETPASARCAVCLPARVTASCTRLVLDQWFTVHACAASGFNDQIGDAMHATALSVNPQDCRQKIVRVLSIDHECVWFCHPALAALRSPWSLSFQKAVESSCLQVLFKW